MARRRILTVRVRRHPVRTLIRHSTRTKTTNESAGVTPTDTDRSEPDSSEDGSFDIFFKENWTHVIRRIRKSLPRTCDADIDGLAQEVFIVVARNWEKLKTHQNPVGFVFKTADNIVLEHFTTRRKCCAGSASKPTSARRSPPHLRRAPSRTLANSMTGSGVRR